MGRQAVVGETECSYPKCTEKAVGSLGKLPLCKDHIEMAEFNLWFKQQPM